MALWAREVGHFDLSRAAKATQRLFGKLNRPDARPDAPFAVHDYITFRALSVLRHGLGLRVPKDVALAAAPEHDLTTLSQPVERMVAHAVRILLAEIEGAALERLVLTPDLVVRGSTWGREKGAGRG